VCRGINFCDLECLKHVVGIVLILYKVQFFSLENVFLAADEDSGSNKDSAPGSRTSTPEPKLVFKDKKEAIEAFKDLLRERVRHMQ